jgi:hypothetical protein
MGGLCGKEDGGDKKTALRVTNPMLQPDAHHVGKDSDFEDDELEPEPEPGDDGQIAAPGIRPVREAKRSAADRNLSDTHRTNTPFSL